MGLSALLLLAALGLGLIMLVSSIYFQWLFRFRLPACVHRPCSSMLRRFCAGDAVPCRHHSNKRRI
jgi:hypothetical protein